MVAKAPDEKNPIRYVSAPADVPTHYVDTCIFLNEVSEVVRMQFVEFIPGAKDAEDPGLKARYVLNMAMPLNGFKGMLRYFAQSISREEIMSWLEDE